MFAQAISKLLIWANSAPSHFSVAQRRASAMLRVGFPMGLAAHATSIFFFLHLGQTVLVVANIAASALLAWATWRALTMRDLRMPVTLVLLVDVPIHNTLASYYLGVESFYVGYLLLAMMLLPFMPYFTRERRLMWSFVIAGYFVVIGAVSLSIGPAQPVSQGWIVFFFTYNAVLVTVFLGIFSSIYETAVSKAERKLESEFQRAEGLLLNILPQAIALRLKDSSGLIADEYSEVSVMFADIVNFTKTTNDMEPSVLVKSLNKAFSKFDVLVEKHQCEKIKTIGDAYMVVSGVPLPREDHAIALIDLALDMREAAREIDASGEMPMQLRIGVSSGPIVAGVIGQKKFAYDLWGDTVNMASRMESHGASDVIQITHATRDRLDERFEVRELSKKTIKGKGKVQTFEVVGRAR